MHLLSRSMEHFSSSVKNSTPHEFGDKSASHLEPFSCHLHMLFSISGIALHILRRRNRSHAPQELGCRPGSLIGSEKVLYASHRGRHITYAIPRGISLEF
jgi:hypothetical protein